MTCRATATLPVATLTFGVDVTIWGASWGFIADSSHKEPAATHAEERDGHPGLVRFDAGAGYLAYTQINGEPPPYWWALPWVVQHVMDRQIEACA